jgi:hypothetical protein
MKLNWKNARPAPSSFDKGGPVYRVRSAELSKTANVSMRAALGAVVAEALRLAPANLHGSRARILFEWDTVYSTLTVVFTDARRNDAPDVLKVFCKGWDRQHQKESRVWEKGAQLWMMTRAEALRAWLDAIVVKVSPQFKKLVPKRGVSFGFKDKDRTRTEMLGTGRFKDPYARS